MLSIHFRGKVAAGLAAACSALLLVAYLTYSTLARNALDRAWVSHTVLVLEYLSDLQSQITDVEANERGFLLTDDDSYLNPDEDEQSAINDTILAIRHLTSDNPSQQTTLDQMYPQVEARILMLREIIDVRKHQGFAAAQAVVANGKGRALMIVIRTSISEMKFEENRLLLARNAELDISTRRVRVFIIIGEALGFCFLLIAGVVVRQEMSKLSQSQEEVRHLNVDLEHRVAERTSELAARSKELERSNLELQQFAYVASHDLQEPLRSISSFTQLLAKRYRENLDDHAREFIDFAVDGCKRMQTLINDLLSFSRVGTDAKPLQPVRCDAILDRALKNLRIAVQECGADIRRSPLPVVMADEGQLTQLFQNLIANALKFRGPQPPCVRISAQRQGPIWAISVRDNGIGIDPEQKDRIFVIFQRLHARTEYPGTGIGLAVCKKIAERHGGTISVLPSPEGGSIFSFTMIAGEIRHANSREETTNSGLRSRAATH